MISRHSMLALALLLCRGVTIATLSGMAASAVPACAAQAEADPAEAFLAKNRQAKGVVETPSGLQYQVITSGAGDARPTDADVALVNYEGKLLDGTIFDKSQQPTAMAVTGVVPGFAEALKLMTKGSSYRFWLKPSLGYGDEVNGPIPAHSVLVFDVQLLDFLSEEQIRQMVESGSAAAPRSQ
jgi:FKBP-type peptidyl-prolyl cis-trans isomerase